MVKEVNPKIHVNEKDYPVDAHHCGDAAADVAKRTKGV